MAHIAALSKLHKALLDTRNGYEEAHADTEDPTLRRLFQQMVDLRAQDHDEIHAAMRRLGVVPRDGTSFMATIHRTVGAVRAAFSGVDRNALSAFANGEENMIESYDAALDEQKSEPHLTEILQRQRAVVAGKIDEMKQMESEAA